MNISGVIPYVRTVLNGLGFKEHPESSNFENVARTHFDTRYHIEFTGAGNTKNAHDNIEIEVPFVVRIFKRYFRDTRGGRDKTLAIGDTVIDKFLEAETRLEQSAVKNIEFDTLELEELDESNDNASRLTMEFTALIIKNARRGT